METVYQYSIKDVPNCEADWIDCTRNVYDQLTGYAPQRIIERAVVLSGWEDLWDEFKTSNAYKQAIEPLRAKAYLQWLEENYQTPIRRTTSK